MGLIEKREIENCLLGSWEIKENLGELLAQITLEADELTRINGFKSYERKLEYLSVRILLKEMLGRNARIIYNKTNKPSLRDKSHNISISHSKNLTSVLLSKTRRVGIDLEFMSHRIRSIAHKFINDKEVITKDPELKRYHLYIHWCAKEALYKICDKGNLNFKESIIISPFEVKESGYLKGTVIRDDQENQFDLSYFRSGDYISVMCWK